jgi:hypothetical protein
VRICDQFLNVVQLEKRQSVVGFEVLTTMAMKSSVFRDITPRIPLKTLKTNGRLGGRCFLHLYGRRISQAGGRLGACFTLVSCLASSLTLKMGIHDPPKRRLTQRITQLCIPENRALRHSVVFSVTAHQNSCLYVVFLYTYIFIPIVEEETVNFFKR